MHYVIKQIVGILVCSKIFNSFIIINHYSWLVVDNWMSLNLNHVWFSIFFLWTTAENGVNMLFETWLINNNC